MIVKFLHIADLHIGFRQYNNDQRFEDFGVAFEKCVDLAISEDVNVCLISGDLFHKASIDPDTLLQAEKTSHDIGVIKRGEVFGYEFLFVNKGQGDLKLLRAAGKTPGDIRVKMPSIIPPGKEGYVYISQESDYIVGRHVLKVMIHTNDPGQPETLLSVKGYVQWPVEILPKPVALMKATKGKTTKRRLMLVNHTKTPMVIKKIEFDNDLFHVETKEIEKGKSFELSVASRPEAPIGEHRKQIVIHTNIPEALKITIASWLKMRERIFTNINALDFGERSFEDINNTKVIEMTTEIVIINGTSTPGFKVLKAECDIDFLKVDLSPIAKDRIHRVDVYFQPEKAKKGKFNGALTILTNDNEFKHIVLPIYGKLY